LFLKLVVARERRFDSNQTSVRWPIAARQSLTLSDFAKEMKDFPARRSIRKVGRKCLDGISRTLAEPFTSAPPAVAGG
jgi:hypothetical protein